VADEKDRADQTDQAPAPRARRRWRVLGLLVLVAFATWTLATIVNILAEGTPSREPARKSSAPPPGRDRVTIAAAGDIGSGKAGNATLEKMARSRPDVYLALGDLSYAGPGSEAAWCDTVRSKIGPIAPFEVVAGNHEEDTGQDGHIRNFTTCLPDRLNAVGEYGRQYYFDLGNLARVILISPHLTIDGVHYFYGRGNQNLAWLSEAIDSARAAGIRWVVVGMHKNCISVGVYYCDIYQDLFSLLIEKRVDLVLHGHEHTYQRSKQLVAPRAGCDAVVVDSFDPDCVVDNGGGTRHRQGAGTIFVVSGAGGSELYNLNTSDPEAGYFDAVMGANRRARHGFASIALTPSMLGLKFVGSTPGSFSDEFEIVAKQSAQ
jgi:3',5'-cyclic AMP phosphodiesterase CpdA